MTRETRLIFIPTYNERENIELIYRQILALGVDADFLFLDDNSPDGTGDIIDRLAKENPRVRTVHRSGKLGIGTAHRDGIAWAYRQGYATLLTMDCDFTHQPEDIPKFFAASKQYDVVVGSRYMDKKSLSDWNIFRKTLTYVGHFLTKNLLKIPYDASGAFRAYRLDRIPEGVFKLVHSKSYSFFFESLHVLSFNSFSVHEVSILLPKRTYGHSKMKLGDAARSVKLLFRTWLWRTFHREEFTYRASRRPVVGPGEKSDDEKAWDAYWNKKEKKSKALYDSIAVFYRLYLIKPLLNNFILKEFKPGAEILHAGCGGGQVDDDVVRHARVTALDISKPALERYQALHGDRCRTVHGSIFELPFDANSFDGIYNLGVMEHFSEEQIDAILAEFHRVLKSGGKAVLFWPPEYGLSVTFLKGVHFILNGILKKNVQLHPDEITRVQSKEHARRIVSRSGFEMESYAFGPRDFFTYSVVVCRKVDKHEPAIGSAVHSKETVSGRSV